MGDVEFVLGVGMLQPRAGQFHLLLQHVQLPGGPGGKPVLREAQGLFGLADDLLRCLQDLPGHLVIIHVAPHLFLDL